MMWLLSGYFFYLGIADKRGVGMILFYGLMVIVTKYPVISTILEYQLRREAEHAL
jgi:hypothetical protein